VFFSSLIFIVLAISNKPLWIDEFLHFVFGAYTLNEVDYVLQIISETTKSINHGQTGLYFFLNFVILNLSGASLWALRAPSLISWLFLAVAVYVWGKNNKFTYFQINLVLLLFVSNFALMQYAIEARPYFPLVASAMLAASYFSTIVSERNRRFYIGLIAAIWGSIMHPYFIVYFVFLFIIYQFNFYKLDFFRLRSLKEVKFDIFLISLVLIFTLLIGSKTWLGRNTSFLLDPFYWTGDGLTFLVKFFGGQLPMALFPINILTVFVVGAFYILSAIPLLNFSKIKFYLLPLAIILGSILISAIISLLSYSQNYWILPRQWVASNALVTFCLFWISQIFYTNNQTKILSYLKKAFVGSIIAFSAIMAFEYYVKTQRWAEEWDKYEVGSKEILKIQDLSKMTNEDLALLANYNVASGGRVWEEFRSFYEPYLGGP
jgi:hypothetical protein